MTSETISIEILPLLRSIWVVTWLVCDKFEFGDKNGPKLLRNGQKWPKIVRNGQKWLLSLKKTRIDLVYATSGPFWSLKGGWVTFFQSRGQNGPKIQFCRRRRENIFINERDQTFTTSYLTQKTHLVAFAYPGNLDRVFFRKIHTHFSPKRPFLAFGGSLSEQKPGRLSVFSSYNPKFYNWNVAPKKRYNFWSHTKLLAWDQTSISSRRQLTDFPIWSVVISGFLAFVNDGARAAR